MARVADAHINVTVSSTPSGPFGVTPRYPTSSLTDVIQYDGPDHENPPEYMDGRLQEVIPGKDVDLALPGESWSIIDNTLVISFEGQEPAWLEVLKSQRDDDGNTQLA